MLSTMETIIRVQNCFYGKCMVANRSLDIGTIVEKYEGLIVGWEEVPLNEICHVLLVSDKNWMIISTDARYINHSCDPNCIINDSLEVITTRPVKKDEELTVRYNIVHKNENPGAWDPRWSFRCLCGSSACQGHVNKYINEDGSEWKPSLDVNLNHNVINDTPIKIE